jgi:hypothetical protein
MQLRLVHILRGKSLVRWICMIAVALASILHVDATFAATSPASNGLSISASQDDGRTGDHQLGSERCHMCAVTAFVSVATPIVRAPGNPVVAPGPASPLVSVDQRAIAPPPRS